MQILSKLTGIIPFSLYELSMYLIVISLIVFIVRFVFIAFRRRDYLIIFIKNSLLNILSILSIGYFLFIILWGLNYNRIPLEATLINQYNLNNNPKVNSIVHTDDDLADLYKYLIDKANKTRELVLEDNNGLMKANSNYKIIMKRAQLGYDNILNIIPSAKGNYANPKYVISSNIMSYSGITGIYFPFTGEANINVAVPDIYIPSTVSHEMAHQRGFASEDEANFIAYLTSTNHPDIDFKYSGYILALNHTASALRNSDYESYINLTSSISTDVRKDLENNNKFWEKYEGEINRISDNFNNSYLKANGVEEGTQSYGKMVDLLLTYYNLYPFN